MRDSSYQRFYRDALDKKLSGVCVPGLRNVITYLFGSPA
ncbi:hypothetical protein FIU82_13120 [Pseudoalteromonas sp. THAF3]|nr:hypothetical protein FIU82_13120 [Pseudoalteromonas sp. THAF3]